MGRWQRTALLLFLLGLATGYAAQAAPLTLEESLRLARRHNPLLQTVRLDRQIARQQVRQADSSLYPRVDLQGGYTAQLAPQAMSVAGQTLETQQGDYPFASVAISQTLYDFGRRDARRKEARAAADAVASGISSQEQEVSLQVIEAYFAVLAGEQLITADKEELDTVTKHRQVAQALFDNGVVTRNDLLQADVRLASARQRLLDQQNRVANLRLQLNFLIGAPPDQHQELMEPVTTPPRATPNITAALARRPDLQNLRSLVSLHDQEVREAGTLFYPELYARLGLDYLQNDKVREQTIYAGTVGLKINLFDGFSSSAGREKAIAVRSRSQQQLQLAQKQARLEIATASNDAKIAQERINVTLAAIRQGEENLRINQDRYQERVGTATEVLDAQTLLTQVRTEHSRAYYDYQVAVARLRKAMGEL